MRRTPCTATECSCVVSSSGEIGASAPCSSEAVGASKTQPYVKPHEKRSVRGAPNPPLLTARRRRATQKTKIFPQFYTIKPPPAIVSLHCSINPELRRRHGVTDLLGPCRLNFGSGPACVEAAFRFPDFASAVRSAVAPRRRPRGPDIQSRPAPSRDPGGTPNARACRAALDATCLRPSG